MLKNSSIPCALRAKLLEAPIPQRKGNKLSPTAPSLILTHVAASGQRVNVWRIGRASSIWSLTGNSSAIESLRFDPTEEFLVSGSAGGAVKLFDLSAGKMTRHFRGHMSNVTVIDCGSFDRRFVTTGSMDCQVGFRADTSHVEIVRLVQNILVLFGG